VSDKYSIEPVRKKTRYAYRSSVTGRYVSKEYAERNPKLTVKEKAK
jgi:hypothetical protein